MEDLSIIVALVTGGAQGIGRSFVESLLRAGGKVAIGDLRNSTGAATQKELESTYPGKVTFIPCDVTNAAEFDAAVKATIDLFGPINMIINNAGVISEVGDKWMNMIKVNVVGVVTGTKLGFKYMSKENGGTGGTVINIASISGFKPCDVLPIYGSTKAFINHFTGSMGQPLHYDPSGVIVFGINPGLTDTPILVTTVDDVTGGNETFRKRLDSLNSSLHAQRADNVGQELLNVLRKAENGSLWVIENDEPAKRLELQAVAGLTVLTVRKLLNYR